MCSQTSNPLDARIRASNKDLPVQGIIVQLILIRRHTEKHQLKISPENVKCDVNVELHLGRNLHLAQNSSVNMEVLTPVKNDESL